MTRPSRARSARFVFIGRAIEDQSERRADMFSRLRPTAPKFTGTLVQIDLDGDG